MTRFSVDPRTTRSRTQTAALPQPRLIGALMLGAALALIPVMSLGQTTAPAADPEATTAAPEATKIQSPVAADAVPPGPTTTTTPAPADAPVTTVAPGTSAADPAADPAPSATSQMRSAVAPVKDAEGKELGTVTAAETASGAVQVTVKLDGIEPGVKAVHIHETGLCEGPDFKSAGGHLAGGKEHGAHAAGGMHAGDLPNLTIGEDGLARADVFTTNVTLDDMLDADGAAFVLHAGEDDYVSQPAGDAGDRIGCGVFAPTTPG